MTERIMKRIIIILAFGLLVPSVALASRVATGRIRAAIERASGMQLTHVPQRCLLVEVTTKDGGNWATVGFNGANHISCARWGFNGVDFVHRAHGRWRFVTSGSADVPCGKFGVPVAVRRDLHLPCR